MGHIKTMNIGDDGAGRVYVAGYTNFNSMMEALDNRALDFRNIDIVLQAIIERQP